MKDNAIINYPGSKKRLLDFILKASGKYINQNQCILDIFSGTGCVAKMFANAGYKVYANDVELYSYNMISSLLDFGKKEVDIENFETYYNYNKQELVKYFYTELLKEEEAIKEKSELITEYDYDLPKVWKDGFSLKFNKTVVSSIQDLRSGIDSIPFCLFTLYYSGYYFGLMQSIEIDSIRYAIEQYGKYKELLLTCLYYSMKETVFAKDGHMAQPLDHAKNIRKLFNVRSKSVYSIFKSKLLEMTNIEGCSSNRTFNLPFDDLIKLDEIKEKVGFIYADPPYTDMQYSRYFHLLNTISNYDYPDMTINHGKLTTGLYAENRYQSKISNRGQSLTELKKLIDFSANNNINLAFSYAFPVDVKNQATNRYTMNIDDLIKAMKEKFIEVEVFKENYSHCNNRNSQQKSVYEYLIIGSNNTNKQRILKSRIENIVATNKNPLYNNMLYWSQKPFNITDILIEELSKDGDLILDPFMGSGVTVIESVNRKYNRKSIGIDINDLPIFLCKTALEVPDKDLIEKLRLLSAKVYSITDEYNTCCTNCGNGGAIITKIVYDIEPTFKIKDIIYKCDCSKKEMHKEANEEDVASFIKDRKISNISDINLLENSRIAVKKGEKISNKFSKRSLYVLDKIKELIELEKDENLKRITHYIYTSIIHKSKILDLKMSSQWPLWIPKSNCIERNVPLLFIDAIERYIKSLNYIYNNYHQNSFVNNFNKLQNNKSYIIQKGTQFVNEDIVPSKSVDLVITDPPYLGQVPYSEYMQLYQSFLDSRIDYDNEIVITNAKNRKKDYSDYIDLMDRAFANVSRMMKSNAYMCMYFHDTSLSVWNDLIKIFNKNNLIFKTSIHIAKSQKTLKKILDPKKTMNGEALLIFQKEESIKSKHEEFNEESIATIRDLMVEIVSRKQFKGVSTSELYDNGVLAYIISNNLLEDISKKYKDLTELFSLFLNWNSDLGLWELKKE